ncbi:MAG: hypothetical protein ACO1TE_23015 [Prosthecobacter sp.]
MSGPSLSSELSENTDLSANIQRTIGNNNVTVNKVEVSVKDVHQVEKVLKQFTGRDLPLLTDAEERPDGVAFFCGADGFSLSNHSMIAVVSEDEHVVIDQGYALADELGRRAERRQFRVVSEQDERLETLTCDGFLAEAIRDVPSEGRLVFIDVNTPQVLDFTRRLFGHGAAFRAASLRRTRVRVLALIDPIVVGSPGWLVDGAADYGIHRTDAIHAWLSICGCDQELVSALHQQRRQGIWAANSLEFLDELRRFLRPVTRAGADKLASEIRERAQKPAATLEQPGNRDTVEQVMLLIAATLQSLPVTLFDRCVKAVLKEEFVELPVQNTGATPPPPATQRVSEADRYQQNKWVKFDRCGLGLYPNAKGEDVVAFDEPGRAARLRAWFESRPIVFASFERLVNDHVLFDPETPQTVVDELSAFFASKAVKYAGDKRRGWLIELTDAVESWLPQGAESSIAENDPYLLRLLKVKAFEASEQSKSEFKAIFHGRIAGVCRAVLAQGNAGVPLVDQLMEGLCRAGASQALLALVQRLRHSDGFDAFKWLAQLLHRGVAGDAIACRLARVTAQNAAIADSAHSPERFAAALKAWALDVVSRERKEANLGPGERYQLGFAALAVEAIAKKSFAEESSLWRTSNQGSLVEQLTMANGPAGGASIALLAAALTHPNLGAGYAYVFSELLAQQAAIEDAPISYSSDECLAGALETLWDNDTTHGKTEREKLSAFMESIANVLPESRRRAVKQIWQNARKLAEAEVTRLRAEGENARTIRPFQQQMSRAWGLANALTPTQD